MKLFKVHPRQSLPNTTALARADRLFAQLKLNSKLRLQSLITAFHIALEEQDPAAIEDAREALNAAEDRYSR